MKCIGFTITPRHAALPLLALLAAPASAADYATVRREITIDRPLAIVWPRISGFCQVGAWLKTDCAIVAGDGGPGTVRRIFGTVEEVMIARTDRSYTYVVRNKAAGLAAGTIEIRPEGAGRSRLIYSTVYEAEATPEARARGHDGRAALFAGLLAAMKAEAEK